MQFFFLQITTTSPKILNSQEWSFLRSSEGETFVEFFICGHTQVIDPGIPTFLPALYTDLQLMRSQLNTSCSIY